MKELAPQPKGIEIKSHQTIKTKEGNITKFKLTPPGNCNGNINTIYSFSESRTGLGNIVKGIEEAENWTKIENRTKFHTLVDEDNTPQEHIAIKTRAYYKALKAKQNIPGLFNNPLFQIIRQEALKQLFEEAEKSQK